MNLGPVELSDLRPLLDAQHGVVSRAQLLEAGATPTDLRRWRRHQLVPVHRGVYVNHTGPLSWVNRSWAAVLLHWPAALAASSVLDSAGDLIHVAVADGRVVTPGHGVRVHHLVRFDDRIQWNSAPPRVRLEDAALTVAAEQRDRTAALALLTDLVQRRRTTPQRLLDELAKHPNLTHRAWVVGVLGDTADGAQSVLEAAYIRRVERAHGLPSGVSQAVASHDGRRIYRDRLYRAYGVCVELDGRVGHELSWDRWRDQDRDLQASLEGLRTTRLGWRHVDRDACRTADRLATLLALAGWSGRPRPCGAGCPVGSTPRVRDA